MAKRVKQFADERRADALEIAGDLPHGMRILEMRVENMLRIKVAHINQEIATELFFRFGKWTVLDQTRPIENS